MAQEAPSPSTAMRRLQLGRLGGGSSQGAPSDSTIVLDRSQGGGGAAAMDVSPLPAAAGFAAKSVDAAACMTPRGDGGSGAASAFEDAAATPERKDQGRQDSAAVRAPGSGQKRRSSDIATSR